MNEEKDLKDDLDFWATNSEEGGWNISSTDEGSQKMLEEEDEKQIKIQTGSDVVPNIISALSCALPLKVDGILLHG